MGRPVALTGTPGVGKSSVARLLSPGLRCVEVGDLVPTADDRSRRRSTVVVDLTALRRAVGRTNALDGVDLVVGHLSHLLPLRDVIVLRCRPIELDRRLRTARRGTPSDRRANFVCEATDVVLVEALEGRRRVFEIDTTARPIGEVAREVRRRLARGGPPRWGRVNWLADPAVTEHLLDRPR